MSYSPFLRASFLADLSSSTFTLLYASIRLFFRDHLSWHPGYVIGNIQIKKKQTQTKKSNKWDTQTFLSFPIPVAIRKTLSSYIRMSPGECLSGVDVRMPNDDGQWRGRSSEWLNFIGQSAVSIIIATNGRFMAEAGINIGEQDSS